MRKSEGSAAADESIPDTMPGAFDPGPVEGGNTGNMFDLSGKRLDCGPGCSYDHLMAGLAVGRDGVGQSARNAGFTPDAGFNPVVSAAFAGQRWARSTAGQQLKALLSMASFVVGFGTGLAARRKHPRPVIGAGIAVSWLAGGASTAIGCMANPMTPECNLGVMSLLSPAGVAYGNGGRHALSPSAGKLAIGAVGMSEDMKFFLELLSAT